MKGKNSDKHPNLHFFGIRHHGPGSAKTLKNALEKIRPDIILLECPADAISALDYFLIDEVTPPVSIMLYNAKSPGDAVFFPLALFSPEWIALKYGIDAGSEIIPFDLPAGSKLTLKRSVEESDHGESENFWDKLKLAGIAEPEKWWDQTIEEMENPTAVFELIEELMGEWRKNPAATSPLNLVREAHMRQELGKIIKKNKEKTIVVVCGAYHIPALNSPSSSTGDRDLLKKVGKSKMVASWVPWSYFRLSKKSGYGAGLNHPAWYEHLFRYGYSNPHGLLSKMVIELRKRGNPVSTARVLDATEMATRLATIRGNGIPGMEEIRDAFMSTIAGNDESLWKIVEEEVLVGKNFGDSGPYINEHPIEKDFQTCLKNFRLSALVRRREMKSRALDLRKEIHLDLSHFLYQLNSLDIPFGLKNTDSISGISSFREVWDLLWSEDYHISLIEAGLYGSTIEKASKARLLERAKREHQPESLGNLIMSALLCGFPDLIDDFTLRLNEKVTFSDNPDILIPVVAKLSMTIKYGDVRNFDPSPLKALLTELIPRICIRFPSCVLNVDDDKAKKSLGQAESLKTTISVLQNRDLDFSWEKLLGEIYLTPQSHPLLSGFAIRQAHDRKTITAQATRNYLSLVFSKAGEVAYQSHWLEGFMSGGSLGILYDSEILYSLNQFMNQLEEESFVGILPVLRRIFSIESPGDKMRLMKMLIDNTDGVPMRRDKNMSGPFFTSDLSKSPSPMLDLIFESGSEN